MLLTVEGLLFNGIYLHYSQGSHSHGKVGNVSQFENLLFFDSKQLEKSYTFIGHKMLQCKQFELECEDATDYIQK